VSSYHQAQAAADRELALIEDIAGFYDDPLGHVLYVYPWGQPGTVLEDQDGPDIWQRELLTELGEAVRAGLSADALQTAIRMAVASGHGIGKTACVAWIIKWFADTRDHPQIVVTANTENQLSSKTWRELAKWHRLAINAHWFEWKATTFRHRMYPDTWFAKAVPWSEHNSQSFAGTHEKHVLVVFDEASTIADSIWEVTDGAMTTPGAMWIAFGNPTENTGRFAECFGRFKHRWNTRHVDSRTAKVANRAEIDQWVADHGEDSDFVRVRVRGLFPRAGTSQFIPLDRLDAAKARKAEGYQGFARVLGVDVARSGECETVVARRQGPHVPPLRAVRYDDLMQVVGLVVEEIERYKPDAVFIDAIGMGWGVVDRLRQLGFGQIVHAVQVSERAANPSRFANKRAEMWSDLRDWLIEGGTLPEDPALERELYTPGFKYDVNNRLLIESKLDMLKRGQPSPDRADALALTFASRVAPRTRDDSPAWQKRLSRMTGGARNPMTA
jgi:hypothetical protein